MASAQRLISLTKDFPILSDLTDGGTIWAAPVARGARSLALYAEECLQQGHRVGRVHEGNYKPGAEAIYISFTTWKTEYKLLCRSEEGAWVVNPKIYEALDMLTSASSWPATLL